MHLTCLKRRSRDEKEPFARTHRNAPVGIRGRCLGLLGTPLMSVVEPPFSVDSPTFSAYHSMAHVPVSIESVIEG
jgi:hypothetical protein